MKPISPVSGVRSALATAVVCAAIGTVPVAQAMPIQTGNPHLNISWDNTLRYNLGWRASNPDRKILNNANYDESNSRFDKGDLVTNRLDLLSELEVVYKSDYGFRVSGAAWYDHAYNDSDVKTSRDNVYYAGAGVWGPSTPSYRDGKYSGHTKRWHHGPSGEILDAFVFGRFELGDVPLNVRAGRHTVYWGEGLLIAGHGVAYAQGPIDGRKAVTSPGTEARELYLPLNQISAQASVTQDISIAAQYFLEWDSTRAPEGGTFLSSGDVALEGPNQLPAAPGVALPFGKPITPDNRGSWGLMAQWYSPIGTLGAYYRKFDEYAPWGVSTAGGVARYVYAEDVTLYGLSWGGSAFGAGAGIDLSYRKDVPLASTGFDARNQGARGDTLHLSVNGTWGLTPTPFWESGVLLAEIAGVHLIDVKSNEQLFNGEGYNCAVGQDRDWGCITRNHVAAAVNFQPEWLQVRPGLDMRGLFSVNYGIYGNAAHGGGNEGMYTYKVGTRGTFQRNFYLELAYNGYGGNTEVLRTPQGSVVVAANGGNAVLSDRDWVSLTASYAF